MPPKPERLWSSTGAPKLGTSLKVLQWNVLADGLAQHGDFVRVRSDRYLDHTWVSCRNLAEGHRFLTSLQMPIGAAASTVMVFSTAIAVR